MDLTMDSLISLLETLNSLSPLAVIGLLGTVIFLLVKGKTAADEKIETVATNHLHEMPELVETMRRIEASLIRIEIKISEDLSFIKAKLINGGSRH
jgi:3'-phosphoadenosine 5'-phosphosulfate sulfotransferase (PAPS reductase)/FAD synthetase